MNDERGIESVSGSAEGEADLRMLDDNDTGSRPTENGRESGSSLLATVESLLFVADRPLALVEIARLLDVTKRAIEKAVEDLGERCSNADSGLRLQRRNGSVQMVTSPDASDAVQRFLGIEHAAPLTKAALESLSIVAYRQPITRPELDDVRGVNSDGVMRTLIARDLVEPVGRRETVGLPIEYGTTYRFLEYFGLTSLDDLPPIEMAGLPEPSGSAPGSAEGDSAGAVGAPSDIGLQDAPVEIGVSEVTDTVSDVDPQDVPAEEIGPQG